MAQLLKYRLTDSETIFIESEDVYEMDGAHAVDVGAKFIDSTAKIVDTFKALPKFFKEIKNNVDEAVKDADKVTIEFGARINAELGFVIAKTQMEGNFKITIAWENNKK